jgi:hypothetical protein
MLLIQTSKPLRMKALFYHQRKDISTGEYCDGTEHKKSEADASDFSVQFWRAGETDLLEVPSKTDIQQHAGQLILAVVIFMGN